MTTATLVVDHGDGRTARYTVAFTPGQSVLDGLRHIRETTDPSLGIRHSCINANSCKECMILIDGRPAYACTTRLEPRDMLLGPLPNKPHLRSLITEIAPPDERLDHAIRQG